MLFYFNSSKRIKTTAHNKQMTVINKNNNFINFEFRIALINNSFILKTYYQYSGNTGILSIIFCTRKMMYWPKKNDIANKRKVTPAINAASSKF